MSKLKQEKLSKEQYQVFVCKIVLNIFEYMSST